MHQFRSALSIFGSLAALFVNLSGAHAADFYKGKTVTVIVGFSPGGGYDAYGRLLAQYLSMHIPGHPGVVVRNMPGAASLTAVRSLDSTQPKDGTVIVIFNPGLIIQSIVQPSKVQLDFRKLAWVGVATPDVRVCYGYGVKGPKTWDQMMNMKQFVIGAPGVGTGDYVNGSTLKRIFGAPVKQVLGFPGSAEVRIAIEQGELDGDCTGFSSIPVDWVKEGQAHIFVRFTRTRPSYVPSSAMFINSFAQTNKQMALADFLDASSEVGRPFVMSSQVSAERVAIMRKAFDEAMEDPSLVIQANKENIPVSPITGQQAEKIVSEEVAKAPAAVIMEAKQIYQ